MASSQRQKEKRELHRKRTALFQEKEEAAKKCVRCSKHSRCDRTAESCGSCSAFAQYAEADKKLEEFNTDQKKVKPVERMIMNVSNYETLKSEGKKDSEIAEIFGVTQPTLSYHKKKWTSNKEKPVLREKKIEAPEKKSVKEPVSQEGEYQKLMSTLQDKITSLEKAEEASRKSAEAWENQFNTVYASLAETEKKLQQFEQTCSDLRDQNKVLQSKNTELFNANKNLNGENEWLNEKMNNKIIECETHYSEMLDIQRKLDTLENESKAQRQLSVLLAKDFVRRNEAELNA